MNGLKLKNNYIYASRNFFFFLIYKGLYGNTLNSFKEIHLGLYIFNFNDNIIFPLNYVL